MYKFLLKKFALKKKKFFLPSHFMLKIIVP
jgi:hypothetical protein